ncbi:MAG: YigZ family protein [Ignavibacteria bacterium]|nr:MAG: YigZ family protein [Ignavibacteria bacterium]
MSYPEQIVTIDKFHELSSKEKGSIFIGQVYHCETEDEVHDTILGVKKKYFDASHHCFAYKFLNEKYKYSDDGEPNGSAGIRILNAIDHFKLLNVLVLVIRYFGGTKLGVGPLGKAYYSSAFNVLLETRRITKSLHQKIIIESDFNFISHIHRLLSDYEAIITVSEYHEKAKLKCWIKPSRISKITNQLLHISKGKIVINPQEEIYYK